MQIKIKIMQYKRKINYTNNFCNTKFKKNIRYNWKITNIATFEMPYSTVLAH